MRFLLIPALLLSLSGCALFGVNPDDAEAARSKAEAAVAVAELAVGFGNVAAAKYAALPDCGGVEVICKDPVVAVAITDGMASLAARLADVRSALASGLNDGERLALITDALVKAAGDVNAIVAKLRGTPGALAAQLSVLQFQLEHMPSPG